MKKFIKILILTTSFIVILTLCFEKNKEDEIEEYNISKVGLNTEIEDNKILIKEDNGENNIIAKLEIPKINLNTDVLNSSDEKSLSLGVGKFWGANPNEIGNFCIAGHNYKRKNMFYRLKELKSQDKIYITDKSDNKIEYIVYSVSKVSPNDVSCLSQETDGNKEITLITCTFDSKKRIIVKAREM